MKRHISPRPAQAGSPSPEARTPTASTRGVSLIALSAMQRVLLVLPLLALLWLAVAWALGGEG